MKRYTDGRTTVIDFWNECLPFLKVTGSRFHSNWFLCRALVAVGKVGSRSYNNNSSKTFNATIISSFSFSEVKSQRQIFLSLFRCG